MDIDYSELSQFVYGRQLSSDHCRRMFSGSSHTLDLLENNNISDNTPINSKQTTIINSDNTQTSESQFFIEDESKLRDFDYLLRLHNYDPSLFELVNAKNSKWNVSQKDKENKVLYSSKITVKPKSNEWSLESIDEYLKNKEFKNIREKYIPTNYDPNGEILEITLPDLHAGLLSWHGETTEDYDIKIAKENFYKCISDIIDRLKNRKFSKIYFVPLGDLLHADTINNTTAKGTLQDCDGRFSKMFDNTLDMIIDAIEMLSKFSKIEVPYISGNHDKLFGYGLIKAVSKAFRNDNNIIIDTLPNPRKFRKEGNILIGWVHGDINKNNITEWLQVEARKEYGETKFAEVHAGHLHHQQTIEKSGMIVRYLPTICASSPWEHSMAFNKSLKTVVSFVWNKECGLREMWFSNI